MSLLTYQEVRPWARSIRQKVLTREMPPWYIDKTIGVEHFQNDVSLSDAEIAAIAAWVERGAPEGNPADLPPPRAFQELDQWHIGEPDLIVQLPQDLTVAADAADDWVDILVDPGLAEDRYIQAIETKPTKGYTAVHHVVTYMRAPDGVLSFLNEYALGKNGDVFPSDTGRLMRANTRIRFDVHLHAVGKQTEASVALAIKFYPKGYVPQRIEITQAIGSSYDIDIPPNTDNARADGYTELTRPVRILSFQPHMHSRGKAQCLEAIYPGGGRAEMLSCVNNYRFNWHVSYVYAEDEQPVLPAGTVLHTISWYNNTASHTSNPDPDALVTYGQRTIDEMSHAWVNFVYLSEEEYQRLRQERAAKPGRVTPSSGTAPNARTQLARGQDVAPVFEGWEQNPDGSYNLVFGYLNRNYEEEVDLPVGPNNTIDIPGMAGGSGDFGQPTHFYPRRQRFVFRVPVPANFDRNQRVVWTLVSQGKRNQAKGWLQPEWRIDDGVIAENSEGGVPDRANRAPAISGPANMTVTLPESIELTAMAQDDGRPLAHDGILQGLKMRWIVYRSAGHVTIQAPESIVEPRRQMSWTSRFTFSGPGTYVLRAIATDGQLSSYHDVTVSVRE